MQEHCCFGMRKPFPNLSEASFPANALLYKRKNFHTNLELQKNLLGETYLQLSGTKLHTPIRAEMAAPIRDEISAPIRKEMPGQITADEIPTTIREEIHTPITAEENHTLIGKEMRTNHSRGNSHPNQRRDAPQARQKEIST